ncbi:YbaN family protein [bacterium]|jgi:uncharacterized protein|nr:YbaN family protein [bacterium]
MDPAADETDDSSIGATIPQVTGARRWLYQGLGCFFVGLGWLGAFLPLLPTTPFLLLASYFFLRSSPRLQNRLVRSKLFGPFLLDWQVHGGVRPKVKLLAFSMIGVVVTISLFSDRLPGVGKLLLVLLAGVGLFVVYRLRTIRD